MNYRESLEYILSFADYERWPGAGYAERWDLRRVEELLQKLGSPHLGARSVHIAGSKGKGSTAAMIASGLNSAGFRVGLYTSPHIHTMRERIKVGYDLITEHEFAQLTDEIRPAVESTNKGKYGELSTFEILTALTLYFFSKQRVEFQVLETGLGGRLDATNVINPEVCVITSVSLDHTSVLGDSIAKIATEKAGIIKPHITVVSSPQVPEAAEVIRTVCADKQARLITVGGEINWRGIGSNFREQSLEIKGLKNNYDLAIPLLGEHQIENAAAAVGTLEILGLGREHIIAGLANVSWPGRIEILKEEPLLIADGAHNGDSAKRLRESLQKHFKFDRTILIIGTSADKNSSAMASELAPFFDRVITTTSQHPRATDAAKLAEEFARRGTEAQITENVEQAVSEALAQAGKRDLICATGSLFLVAEVIEQVKGITGERYPKFSA